MLFSILLILSIVAGGLVAYFGVANTILWLATKDRWWSIYRKKLDDGQYFFLTRGKDLGGPFAGIVESVKDWLCEDNIFVPLKGATSRDGSWLSDVLGIAPVGTYKRIYSRERTYYVYNTMTRKLEEKEMKGEKAKIFFFQTNLAVAVTGAETADKVKIDGIIPFVMRTLDPNKAEFLTGKPEKVISDIVLARARAYVATKTYDQMLKESGDLKNGAFIKYLEEANPDIEDRHGIVIFAPYLVEIDLSRDEQVFANATRLKAVRLAEQEAAEVAAKTVVIEAQGQAAAIRIRNDAIASIPGGVAVAVAEAQRDAVVNNTKASTLVLGSAPVAISPTPNP